MLDFGCGAGVDLVAAASLTGHSGRVVGVDLTEEMVQKARKNLASASVPNGEVVLVESESLPFPDCSFDLVISNGVINLSPHKQECFLEIRRILKPGGELRFADVVLDAESRPDQPINADAWSQ